MKIADIDKARQGQPDTTIDSATLSARAGIHAAGVQQCAERVVDGQWEFLNLDTDACGRLGVFVAINSVVREGNFVVEQPYPHRHC